MHYWTHLAAPLNPVLYCLSVHNTSYYTSTIIFFFLHQVNHRKWWISIFEEENSHNYWHFLYFESLVFGWYCVLWSKIMISTGTVVFSAEIIVLSSKLSQMAKIGFGWLSQLKLIWFVQYWIYNSTYELITLQHDLMTFWASDPLSLWLQLVSLEPSAYQHFFFSFSFGLYLPGVNHSMKKCTRFLFRQ